MIETSTKQTFSANPNIQPQHKDIMVYSVKGYRQIKKHTNNSLLRIKNNENVIEYF